MEISTSLLIKVLVGMYAVAVVYVGRTLTYTLLIDTKGIFVGSIVFLPC